MAVEKGVPCYREENASLNKWLLKVRVLVCTHMHSHTCLTQNNKPKDYGMRAAKNCTWNAAGRAGEISKSKCREHLSLDRHFRKIRMDWTQVKTGKMKVVFFASHAYSYVCCVFNSLLSHLVVNRGTQTRGDYLFPDLCEQKQPSHKMTKLWKDFYEDVQNEHKIYTPTGITAAVRSCDYCRTRNPP
jgi:hypothetical protein